MSDTHIRTRLLVLTVLIAGVAMSWLIPRVGSYNTETKLTVDFFDVGQGDSIFITTPEGVQILIDGGPDATVLRELAKVMTFGDRTIDLVVSTHPDSDHIGGLIDVLERYHVDTILTTENAGESNTAELYQRLVQAEGADVVYARRGQIFLLGASTTLSVLYPDQDVSGVESNSASIIFQVSYDEKTFLFTGDAPKQIEEYLVLTEGAFLESDVLKVGHHGSRTSTSELFLAEVAPVYAVISAAKDSRYGHPHVEVTDALFNARVETVSTAELGTIRFVTDGQRIELVR